MANERSNWCSAVWFANKDQLFFVAINKLTSFDFKYFVQIYLFNFKVWPSESSAFKRKNQKQQWNSVYSLSLSFFYLRLQWPMQCLKQRLLQRMASLRIKVQNQPNRPRQRSPAVQLLVRKQRKKDSKRSESDCRFRWPL